MVREETERLAREEKEPLIDEEVERIAKKEAEQLAEKVTDLLTGGRQRVLQTKKLIDWQEKKLSKLQE